MIISTGVDILEVKRMESLLKDKPWPEKLFTKAEISPCEEEGFAFKRIVFRLAGIFAAKESVMKALEEDGDRAPLHFENIHPCADDHQLILIVLPSPLCYNLLLDKLIVNKLRFCMVILRWRNALSQ